MEDFWITIEGDDTVWKRTFETLTALDASDRLRRYRDPRLPLPGTMLTRNFRGETFTVHVLEEGFRYEDHLYRSLSAIARQISGTQWNGFLFFV